MHKNDIFLFLLGCLRFISKIDAQKEEIVDECRFLNCPNTPLHLKEGDPSVGIYQIQAECTNKTNEIIYGLFYSKVVQHDFLEYPWSPAGNNWLYLTIDNKTGWINSTGPVSRSWLKNKSFVDVIVTAVGVEKGLRVLKSCSFGLYIDDINNNAPIVAEKTEEILIDPSLNPFIVVDRVAAYDNDLGDNGRLTFFFYNKTTPNLSNYWPFNVFAIDENTGIIYVKEDIPQVRTNRFFLPVIVSDNGSPPLSTATMRRYRIL